MFLQTNDRLINLKNVSNINVIRDYENGRFRIVFNMNYSIEIHGRKRISDYVYWDAINIDDLNNNIEYLRSDEYFKQNYIRNNTDCGCFINKNEISSIKFSEKKNRVIFNLSHPVTFTDWEDKDKITSEFVYVNCTSFDEYQDYVKYVKETLK